CGRAADLPWTAPALLARAGLDPDGAQLLRRDDGAHRPLLARVVGAALGVGRHVARAAVDPLQRHAGRPGAAYAAIRRRPVCAGRGPRAAVRDQAMSPTAQGAIVLI